jgi:hypothetical protein
MTPVQDAGTLLEMSQNELDRLFCQSEPGPIPEGRGEGTAIIAPGTMAAKVMANLARWLFWQGKVFNPASSELKNRITPFGIRSIRAKVYLDESWLDQRPTIVLDYSKTSFLAQKIRDEIREVGPGIYLGKVYWGRKRLIDFSLRFE